MHVLAKEGLVANERNSKDRRSDIVRWMEMGLSIREIERSRLMNDWPSPGNEFTRIGKT